MDWSMMREFWKNARHNKAAILGLLLLIFFIAVSIGSMIFGDLRPDDMTPHLSLPPFWSEGGRLDFLLGTDDLGRDILTRLICGARVSLGIGLAVVVFSLVVGTVLGLAAGVFGGGVDKVIMRGIDILMSFPSILLAIVIVAILGIGLLNAIIAVSVVSIPKFARIVRSSVLVEMKKQYVLAARSFGASKLRLMFIEILPNCLGPVIVQATLGFSDAILDTAALGFLGLGAKAPLPEWGTMLADARPYIESSPWMVTLPGLCILLVVLAFNLFGDGLRDALDPKLRR